jgi:hypothetical protein
VRRVSRNSRLPRSTKKLIRLYAIRIDETENYDRDWLERFGSWAPRIWSVYVVRPGQPSYVGSLKPSIFAMHAYSHCKLPDDTPSEIGERIASDLRTAVHDDLYLDFKLVQGIIRTGKDILDLGLIKTEDESLTDCQDAWEAAREHVRTIRPF